MVSESFVTYLDLADAKAHEAREALRNARKLPLWSRTSDAASLGDACAQSVWMLRTLGCQGQDVACGLLLVPVLNGLTSAEAESSAHRSSSKCGRSQNRTPDSVEVARRMVQD